MFGNLFSKHWKINVKRKVDEMKQVRFLFVCVPVIWLFSIICPLAADPLDTVYWKTFHINTIGVGYDVSDYRQSMLTNTMAVMPKNIKVGFASLGADLMRAQGNYYDYLPDVFLFQSTLEAGRSTDMTIGTHLNAMPWNDSANQDLDILHNYLEKYDNGSLLQQDRQGRIRNASKDQDPTIDEETSGTFDFLEMQLSLSPYAPLVQDYTLRNTRLLARYFSWLREEAPDVVAFCTLTSETGQNLRNSDFFDYSEWSKLEFSDWLSGDGLYEGKGQYSSLSALNSAFGLSFSSWDDVEPPTTVSWGSDATGLWWQKWHEFRIAQVQHFEQAQMSAVREAGWSPDRLFGHQQPGIPEDTEDILYTMKATPWTTTFVKGGGNGVTTYKENASNTNIFSALYADDKSWGLVEYNPKTNGVAQNVQALETVFHAKAHLICPYHWSADTCIVKGSDFESALQQFIGNHSNDVYSGMAEHETAAESRSVLWTMSYDSDIEVSSGWNSLDFNTGICYGIFSQDQASLTLELDELRHTLVSDAYYAMSARMFFSNAPDGDVVFQWTDTNNAVSSVSMPVQQGWNLCRVNLAELSGWREKNIKSVKLLVDGGSGNQFQLDWLQLEAGHCWHLNDLNEVPIMRNFSEASVTNGMFVAINGTADSYFHVKVDSDRLFVDADFCDRVRVRMYSSTNGIGQIYWWRDDAGPFNFDFDVSVGMHTYDLNMSATSEWHGQLKYLRLDPINQNGAVCSVDYMTVTPLMLPPRSPFYDTIVNSPNPVFSWETATEPDNSSLLYEFQLATDFGFTNKVVSLSGLTSPETMYIGPELDGCHWWRARVRRSGTGYVSPWMVPMPVFLRSWHCDSTNDFVSLHGFSNEVVFNGVWSAQTGFDPYFKFNTGVEDTSEGINADLYKRLQFRICVDASETNSAAQLWFYPKDGGAYWTSLAVPSDGQWHDITVDLSTHQNWGGAIESVRLDPTVLSNATVSIDWARFMPASDGDFDDDGIADSIEGTDDPDGDGLENFRDTDSDGDGQEDGEENSNGRDPYDASDMAFHFEIEDDFEGWVNFANIENASVSNSLLSGLSTSVDPYIYRDGFQLDSDEVDLVHVRLSADTDQSGLVVLYWKYNDVWQPAVVSYTNLMTPQVYTLNVNGSPYWDGTIETLRLDPFGGESNVEFSIDWIIGSDGDRDDDGIADGIDGIIDTDGDGFENFRDTDSDGDGISDATEGAGDADSDGVADFCDTDSDDDGIADGEEASGDLDGDGFINRLDADSDGDGVDDGDELSSGRDPYDAADLAFHFNTDGDREGWLNAGNINPLAAANGVLSGVTTSGDPMVVRNNFDLLNTADISNVYVRLKASVAGVSQFYWRDSSMNYYGLNSSYTESNEWQVMTFDVSEHAAWIGSLAYLRVDPINQFGETFEIDWILASDGDFDDDGIADSIEGIDDLDGDGFENFRDTDSDGDSVSDAVELSEGRDPYDASDLAFHFNTDSNFEGWTNLANIACAVVSNGTLSGVSVSSSTDPFVFNTACAVDSDGIETIYVKMAAEEPSVSVFYWKLGTTFKWTVANYTKTNDWQILSFNVGSHADWDGIISYLRVDPVGLSNTAFAIDWILASDGDLDNDGIADSVEGTDDLDGDGTGNFQDLDSDGDGASDADEALNGSDPYDASSFAFHFETDDCFEGWANFANIANGSVSNGVLAGLSTSRDPFVYNTNSVVDSDEVSTMYMKLSAEQSGQSVFYWKYLGVFQWAVASYTNTGNPQILTFDVGSHTNWTGIIDYLRVDPINTSNTVFAMDWIISSDGDVDDDGLPDSQESKEDHDNDSLEDFRDWDSDGDGISDGDELGLNFLIIPTGISVSGGFCLNFTGYRGCTYFLERTESLVQPDWQLIQSVGPFDADGVVAMEDPSPEFPSSFYRVLSVG